MSRGGRGMRGGRGRFGRGGNSVTHDLIRDNMEDMGMDAFQADDRIPPPLYPHVEQAFPSDLTEEDEFMITKSTQLLARLQASASFLSRDAGAKVKNSTANRKPLTLDPLALFPDEDRARYVPGELLSAATSGKITGKARSSDIFQRLEAAEGNEQTKDQGERKEGEESEGEEVEEVEEEVLDDDYMVDHYASDGDNDDNDDYEATY